MDNQQKEQPKSATQRIGDLENAVMNLYQTLNGMAKDIMTIKEALKLLGNKSDAMVKVGGFADADIDKAMVANNVAELKAKVDGLVAQGVLVADAVANENSFVVGREIDADDKVVNPRIQFVMTSIPPDAAKKIVGAKPGDVLTFGDGKLKLAVDEVFTVVVPEPPKAEMPAAEVAPAAAQAEAATDAAPAATEAEKA
jgi:hypothetical protein